MTSPTQAYRESLAKIREKLITDIPQHEQVEYIKPPEKGTVSPSNRYAGMLVRRVPRTYKGRTM